MALTNHILAPAAAAACCFGRRVPLPPPHQLAVRRKQKSLVVAMADLLGDFGARDPFPEEIESNFGERVLGNVDTLHNILIPTLSVLSIARLPLEPNPAPVDAADARRLLHKVVGWRLLDDADGMRLQCVWKVRDEACGHELVARINAAVDGAPATVVFEAPNQVRAELQTPSAGGLTVNDFIVAARIDKVKTVDLIPKKRVWA
ncbi:probable pterin-4-alpha-carbinolamine dehydratase, chloroplastic [Oryza glaberrima]|nr:probable pterin-4-alpha-carbinolamine dehydratase, chloroplastic [Oryza glaberrima]